MTSQLLIKMFRSYESPVKIGTRPLQFKSLKSNSLWVSDMNWNKLILDQPDISITSAPKLIICILICKVKSIFKLVARSINQDLVIQQNLIIYIVLAFNENPVQGCLISFQKPLPFYWKVLGWIILSLWFCAKRL